MEKIMEKHFDFSEEILKNHLGGYHFLRNGDHEKAGVS